MLALVSGAAVVLRSTGPIKDVDLFWHLKVGGYFLEGHGFPFPDPFAFTLPTSHWHTTEWLAEALLAAVYRVAGLGGLIALRLVLVLVLLAALGRLLVKGSKGWSGPVVFTLTAVPLIAFIQDRPQLPSLIFVVWLAAVTRGILVEDRSPHTAVFVFVTYLWANVHGLFVLGPVLLVLIGACDVARGSRERRRRGWRLMRTALIALAVCAFTPRGPALLIAPFTVTAAARGFIMEWAPTSLSYTASFGLYGILALLLVAAARGSRPLPLREIAYVLALTVFGLLAVRNAAPATILLAPVALAWCDAAWDTRSAVRMPTRWLHASVVALLIVTPLSQIGKPVLPSKPRHITGYLATLPLGTRILNDYNLSGYLILGAPHVRLTIDGRADRYGAAFIADYLKAVSGAPGWERWVRDLGASYAVLSDESPLPQLLQTTLGWRRVLTDDHFVLLVAPPAQHA